jgi:hypothetical protein
VPEGKQYIDDSANLDCAVHQPEHDPDHAADHATGDHAGPQLVERHILDCVDAAFGNRGRATGVRQLELARRKPLVHDTVTERQHVEQLDASQGQGQGQVSQAILALWPAGTPAGFVLWAATAGCLTRNRRNYR